MGKQIVIRARVLYDGKKKLTEQTVIVEDGKIVEVSKKALKADFEGYVTPAFIDAHSHIGMFRDGEPDSESEGNDISDQFMPMNDPLNSIYFDDRAFKDAVDFGVLYSCVVPGSGNLIGGRAMIIKNWAENRKDALLKDYGYKMALGFNPRSTGSWKGKRPNTRMGVYSMLEEKFDKLLIKKEKAELERDKKLLEIEKKAKGKDKLSAKEIALEKKNINRCFELSFEPEENMLLEILGAKKTAKIHVHKEDDVLYLIELVKKYKLKATADHTCDVFHKEIYEELAKAKIPVVFGPLGGIGGKIELAHAYYQNAELLMKSKAEYGLMTDHPVIWTPHLRDSLKFFLINGMKDEEAISVITYKNAKILGIDDTLGTVEKGKVASLIVWDKEPLNLAAFPKMVMAEGRILRKK
ncbi:MAG: amidohydrolase family protein [Candidatus Delongbacteria bacterium]|nr:amidohydrolase family protein [Candidatus Delongbacteria bacterium]MDD4205358.1 amidohydrolase family protein [Candidatus Delongbacteria bacterium]